MNVSIFEIVILYYTYFQLEEESFNPDYIEVDRLLDMSESTDETGKSIVHYLVKWKALPYEDATWELEDDVDIAKVSVFYYIMKACKNKSH